MSRLLCLALIFMIQLGSCSSTKVGLDYDTEFNFATLKTYAWQTRPAEKETLVRDRVYKFTDRELSNKGYQRVELAQGPDFIIDYQFGTTQLQRNGVSTGIGVGMGSAGGYGGLGFGIPIGVRDRKSEFLGLNIFNPDSQKLLWHASATEPLMESNPNRTDVNFVMVIEALIEKFPPGQKK